MRFPDGGMKCPIPFACLPADAFGDVLALPHIGNISAVALANKYVSASVTGFNALQGTYQI